MKRKKNNELFFFAGVIVVIIIIIAMIVLPNRDSDSSDSNDIAGPNVPPIVSGANTTPPVNDVEPVSPPTPAQPEVLLAEVIDAADAWMPCAEHQPWVGKPAPDFTLTDLGDKKHTLSSYKGKSVIINLWSPWFKPTHEELDTLIQLRQAISTDELMILGVSFDSDVTVQRFVNKQTAINFPIISVATQSLPAPYSTGKPYPCSLFITPDGILKLSARGSIPLEDFKAILAAQ